MKRDSMSKLSASLIVLVLALSALALLPVGNTGQTPSGKNIYVPVFSGGLPVINAFVNLTDVHTGAVSPASYVPSFNSYRVENAQSGFYRVDVVAANYFDQLNALSFRYNGYTDNTTSTITLTKLNTKIYTWNVTVTLSDGGNPQGAWVGFYSIAARELVSTAAVNNLGTAILTMFGASPGQYVLVGTMLGYETNATNIQVSSNNATTMKLFKSLYVAVPRVTDVLGKPASNVVSYLINRDPSVVWIKRVMKSIDRTYFDAYPGTFTLVVDAKGLAADVEPVVVTNAPVQFDRTLLNQTQRVERVNASFGSDFNSFTLDVSTKWSYDDAYPGLMFNDMGSLRAQVDLTLGNGDGILTAPEVTSFFDNVKGFESQYTTSSNLLQVNETTFTSAGSISSYVMDLVPGSIIDTNRVNYSYACAYTSHTPIAVLVSKYKANLTAQLNSPSVNYCYNITLVSHYELTRNQTVPGSPVKVMGYLTVAVNSNQLGTGSELVTLTLEASQNPVAGAAVSPSAAASVVKNENGTVVLRYIVRYNASVTFTANSSSDPNGNPLTYLWDFDDGTPIVPSGSSWAVHKFTSSFASKKVNLTVQDVAGLEGFTLVNITSDSLDPVPIIGVNKLAVGNTIKVNQSQLVIFNATNCYDDAAAAGDHLGVINFVQFFFGDKNLTGRITWDNPNKNASHSYERSDDYVVTLNVTDVVGHFKNTTLNVHVNDTTNPTVAFTVRNQTYGDNLAENQTLHFDANTSKDNVNNYTLMYYSWGFGDGTWKNGTGSFNVTHTYKKVGQVIVTLRVNDSSNNTGVLTRVLSIASGPRPNVAIDNLFFSPQTAAPFAEGNMTQGKTGTILVNLTNKGNAIATNVIVSFYLVPADGGTPQKIGESGSLFNTTTGLAVTTIEPGGKVQVRFAYSPPNRGTFTIKVNVTSTDQLVTASRTNNALHVNESPLTRALLYLGVVVVIVGVPLLIFFRSRWSKREKKGPRRERKEKEPEEEEKS